MCIGGHGWGQKIGMGLRKNKKEWSRNRRLSRSLSFFHLFKNLNLFHLLTFSCTKRARIETFTFSQDGVTWTVDFSLKSMQVLRQQSNSFKVWKDNWQPLIFFFGKTTFEIWKCDIVFFTCINAESVLYQWTHTTRNSKGSSADRSKMVTVGKVDLSKEIKSTRDGNYMGKYMIFKSI